MERKKKAFLRLQEEIIKRCADQSKFAWKASPAFRTSRRGFFARSRNECKDCSDSESLSGVSTKSFAVTNKEFQIFLPLQPVDDDPYFPKRISCQSKAPRMQIPTN
jgi:hypothetical protein